MTAFPEPPTDDYAVVYLEDTDKPLPNQSKYTVRLFQNDRARGGGGRDLGGTVSVGAYGRETWVCQRLASQAARQ